MMRRVILFLALLSFAYAQDSKFGGIYLPDVYLSELSKSKSHVVATKKFYEQTDAEERALVITPDGITYIYGNEAEGRDIIKIDKNKITVEKKSYDDENTSLDIYITGEGKIKNANGVKYSRISSETDGATNIMMHFITEAIFTDKHYKNKAGDELYR
ncbi:MAG: hypothetical protein LBS73_00755, partial [Campylobacteraceae bacterium]|nr:hypothetical protein [Campylobacteraceae bacterium]